MLSLLNEEKNSVALLDRLGFCLFSLSVHFSSLFFPIRTPLARAESKWRFLLTCTSSRTRDCLPEASESALDAAEKGSSRSRNWSRDYSG